MKQATYTYTAYGLFHSFIHTFINKLRNNSNEHTLPAPTVSTGVCANTQMLSCSHWLDDVRGLRHLAAKELDIEYEVRVRRDDASRAASAVAHVGGAVQSGALADLHLGDALVPALDHLKGSE